MHWLDLTWSNLDSDQSYVTIAPSLDGIRHIFWLTNLVISYILIVITNKPLVSCDSCRLHRKALAVNIQCQFSKNSRKCNSIAAELWFDIWLNWIELNWIELNWMLIFAARLSEREADSGQVRRHVQNVFPEWQRWRVLRPRLPHLRPRQERLHRLQGQT